MTSNQPETYSLEEAGRTLDVSVSDIESYIEEGLIEPGRDASGARVFSRAEMRRLWSIVTLHRDLGINLPGVAAVLRLREQFEQMRRDMATLVEIAERELGPDVWDRLWPEGRPRPASHISVDGVADLPDAPQTDRGEPPASDQNPSNPSTGGAP